jgi:hypothetical protein
MAVGWQEAGLGRPRPYAVRLAGGRWESIAISSLPRGSAVLTDVELASARKGWAVGYLVARRSDRHIVFLLRWDGRRWSREPLPWADEVAAVPRSVSVGSDGRLWIVGTQTPNDQRDSRGFVAHRPEGTWQVDVLGVPPDVRSEVMDVAAIRSGAVAAASVGASLLVVRTCQASATSGSRKAGVARIKVGHMKARRKARADEDALSYFDGQAASASAISIAGIGRARRLPAPVAPIGFYLQDVAAQTGLAQWTPTFGGFSADFDDNGYRDVFYSRHGDLLPRLAMNGPSGFVDAPTDAFSVVDRHGCDSADVGLDGNRDILSAVGASRGKAVKRHELSLAPDKDTRALANATQGISDPLGRGRDIGFLHLDPDPYPEAFITSAPDREDGLPSYNRFYRNQGGTFVPGASPTGGPRPDVEYLPARVDERQRFPERLPVEDHALLVADDLGQMARLDQEVVPRACVHHGAVRHRVADTA